MMYILATVSTEIVESVVENQITNQSGNLIGIGGIVATILVGAITCYMTWKTTMKTIQQLKIAYNIQIFPILSKSVTELNLIDLQIKYKEKQLPNPCLLTLDIVNNGNKAIINPPIKIKLDEDIEIIPGYFEDIPAGYEKLWNMKKENANSCIMLLEHINPKQVVKARFFLDRFPTKELVFECATPDLVVQKISNTIESNVEKKLQVDLPTNNIIILIITVLLFFSIDYWVYNLDSFFYHFGLRDYLQSYEVVLFVMGMLTLTNIFNICGLKSIDSYLLSHLRRARIIKSGIVVICSILLFLIVFNIIHGAFIQVFIAAVIAVLLAFLLHCEANNI